jgi:hypothetical protein
MFRVVLINCKELLSPEVVKPWLVRSSFFLASAVSVLVQIFLLYSAGSFVFGLLLALVGCACTLCSHLCILLGWLGIAFLCLVPFAL